MAFAVEHAAGQHQCAAHIMQILTAPSSQYLVVAPSFVNVLNVYAFCNLVSS
jgi:cellulose synthase/poly-beta-1,6-N-acetylglucosamine synthase-like glycosyltransferase